MTEAVNPEVKELAPSGRVHPLVRRWRCWKCLWTTTKEGLTQGQATEGHDAANIVLRIRCHERPKLMPNAKAEALSLSEVDPPAAGSATVAQDSRI